MTIATKNTNSTAVPVQNVLRLLPNAKRVGNHWMAKCPAHEDGTASLQIAAGDDGRALLKCFAGCNLENIIGKMGMKIADLFPPRQQDRPAKKIVATYDYIDAEGQLVYQAVLYEPKDFRQRRPDGRGGWIWNLEGVTRILYQLPELLNSAEDRPDELVFIPEGEKDVDNIRAVGLIATCNVGGAGKWKKEYSEILRGRRVCIIADPDEPGRRHAQQVAASLHGIASEIKIVEVGQ
jgi:putative DNA primase/helicase